MMLSAFMSAVDYLLKPVDKNELALAIAKVAGEEDDGIRTMESGKISFRTVSGRLFVDRNDIAYIRADGNYVEIVMFDSKEVVFESLLALERHLDPKQFVRADRSTIVNLKHIYKLNTKRRACMMKSQDGSIIEVEISKRGIDMLANLI